MGNLCKDLEYIPWLCLGKGGVGNLSAPGDVVPQLSSQGSLKPRHWSLCCVGGEESKATAGVKLHLLQQQDWRQPGWSGSTAKFIM